MESKFEEMFPFDMYVDCEVWFGKGCFPDAQKLVKESADLDWASVRSPFLFFFLFLSFLSIPIFFPPSHHNPKVCYIRIVAFDKPDFKTHHLSFETRYQLILENVPIDHPFLVSLKNYSYASNNNHLINLYD